jgi:hypothetical protein
MRDIEKYIPSGPGVTHSKKAHPILYEVFTKSAGKTHDSGE